MSKLTTGERAMSKLNHNKELGNLPSVVDRFTTGRMINGKLCLFREHIITELVN